MNHQAAHNQPANTTALRRDVQRYGFNGKEKDDENFAGAYDFGARILDSRLGRWMSSDPCFALYSYQSSYLFSANSPLLFIDSGGTAETPVENSQPTNVIIIVASSAEIRDNFQNNTNYQMGTFHVIIVNDIEQALESTNGYTDGRKIDNLVIMMHTVSFETASHEIIPKSESLELKTSPDVAGEEGRISWAEMESYGLADQNFNLNTEEANNDFAALQGLLALAEDGGNIVFGACSVMQNGDLYQEVTDLVQTNCTLYMSGDDCELDFSAESGIVQVWSGGKDITSGEIVNGFSKFDCSGNQEQLIDDATKTGSISLDSRSKSSTAIVECEKK